MIGDAIDIRAPFDIACITFLIACVYVRFGLPYISPESMSNKKPGRQGIAGFFAPLKILVPQRMRSANGSIKKHYGVVILCAGIFLGVVRSKAYRLTSYLVSSGLTRSLYSLQRIMHLC